MSVPTTQSTANWIESTLANTSASFQPIVGNSGQQRTLPLIIRPQTPLTTNPMIRAPQVISVSSPQRPQLVRVVITRPKSGDIVIDKDNVRNMFDGRRWRRLCVYRCDREAIPPTTSCVEHVFPNSKAWSIQTRSIQSPVCVNGNQSTAVKGIDSNPPLQKKSSDDQLTEDNQMLSKELMIANKCVSVLTEVKQFIESNSQQFTQNLGKNVLLKFEELNTKVKEVLSEREKCLKPIDNSSTNDCSVECDEQVLDNWAEESLKRPLRRPKPIQSADNSSTSQLNVDSTLEKNSSEEQINRKKPFTCKYPGCQYRCRSRYEISEHVNKHTGKRPHECQVCHKTYKARYTWQKHMLTHRPEEEKQLYICDHPGCDHKTRHRESFRNHKAIHSGDRRYECADCGKRYFTATARLRHRQYNHKQTDQLFVCDRDNCGKQCRSQLALKFHQKMCNKEKTLFCDRPNCPFAGKDKHALTKHISSVHATERPFKCTVEECDKWFKTLSAQRSHTELHTKTWTLLECTHEGCDKRYKTRNSLDRHKLIHLDVAVKAFRCDWPGCEFSTNHKQSLSKHSVVHTGQCRYVCSWPECERKFKWRGNYHEHLMTHKGHKPHVCHWPGCDYRTITSQYLKRHIAKNHEKQVNDNS